MKSEKIDVVIVDDHPVITNGISSYCRKHTDINIVSSPGEYRSAIAATAKYKPNVILLDITVGELNGLDFLDELLEASPQSAVIVYTAHTHRIYFLRAMKLGAKGYALKRDPLEQLIAAIRTVRQGGLYISSNLPGDYLESLIRTGPGVGNELDNLTPRELEIANLLARGKTAQNIAGLLYISPKTVRVHRSNLMRKLSCVKPYDLFIRLQEYFPGHHPLP
jgi:DNA-binding NarL/FixJ family response regulator